LTIALDGRHALHASDAQWAASGIASLILPDRAAEQAMLLTALEAVPARATE
jgi:hypothetical protein